MSKSKVRTKVNELLYQLLSYKPSKRTSGDSGNTSTASAGTSSNGTAPSAYTSAQAQSTIGSSTTSGATSGSSAGPWGSIIGGILGLAGGIVDTGMNMYNAKLAYDKQIEYTNEYLTPEAQARHYQAAGLNPMALAGGGAGVTSAPSTPQADSSSFSESLQSILGAINQSQMTQANVSYVEAQTEGQRIANRWKDQKEQWDLKMTQAKWRRETLGYDIDEQTLRSATASADTAEVYAQYYPDLLKADLDNKTADTALKSAQTTMTEEQTNKVKQEISQAEQRFPEEMKQIRAKTAEIQANTAYLKSQKEVSDETKNEVIERTNNLIKERDLIIKKTNLAQKEYDCYNAIHSEVTLAPDLSGNGKDRVVVKSPDGTVTSFDMLGIEKTFKRDLSGNKIKKK